MRYIADMETREKQTMRRPVNIGGKLYPANSVVKHNGQSYIAHDLARRLKRKARRLVPKP